MYKQLVLLFLVLNIVSPLVQAEVLNHIVAVVEDDVILDNELTNEVANIVRSASPGFGTYDR